MTFQNKHAKAQWSIRPCNSPASYTVAQTRRHTNTPAQTKHFLSSYATLRLANTQRRAQFLPSSVEEGKRSELHPSKQISFHSAVKCVRKALNPIFQHHQRIFLKTQKETFTPKDQLGSPFRTSLNSPMRK